MGEMTYSVVGSHETCIDVIRFSKMCVTFWASQVAQLVRNLPAIQETWVRSLDWEDPMEKGKATHSRVLAWKIPWTTWSMGSQRVRHN